MIIAKARINNVHESSNKFVQHLLWASASFSLGRFGEYYKIVQNKLESVRSYNVGNSQWSQIQLHFYVIGKLFTRPCVFVLNAWPASCFKNATYGKAWYWLCVQMFRLVLSSHNYFLLFETPIVTLSPCSPKHGLWQLVFWGASEFKVRNLIKWTVHFAIYVHWLLGWRYILSLHSADESQNERNSCPLLRFCFIGSSHVGVSRHLSRSISLAIYCLYIFDFLAD